MTEEKTTSPEAPTVKTNAAANPQAIPAPVEASAAAPAAPPQAPPVASLDVKPVVDKPGASPAPAPGEKK